MRPTSLLTLSFAAVLACGGGSDGPSTTGPNYSPSGNPSTPSATSVTVADNSFEPSSLTVAAGATVTWTFGGYSAHNVTFDDGQKSTDKSSGTYERAFATAGTYKYHCTIHGTGMSGTITVQ